MRHTLLAVVSALALTGVAAHAAPLAPTALAQAAEYSDAQLLAYDTAMAQVRAAAPTDGSAPSAEQQSAMAAAVATSGMDINQFNAMATAVSSSDLLKARLAVLKAPASPAGSIAASVTDAELAQFGPALQQVRDAAPAPGVAPTAEQQAAMAAAVQNSGLELDRFNAIAGALSSDARLRARLELVDLQN